MRSGQTARRPDRSSRCGNTPVTTTGGGQRVRSSSSARDDVAGIDAAEGAAASLPDATLVRLPAGHFDLYEGSGFDRCVRHGIAFLDATVSR